MQVPEVSQKFSVTASGKNLWWRSNSRQLTHIVYEGSFNKNFIISGVPEDKRPKHQQKVSNRILWPWGTQNQSDQIQFFLMIPREFPFLPLHMRYILPYKAMIIKSVSYWHNAKTKTCLHSTFILNLKCDFRAEIIFCRIDENKSKLGRRENWHHWSNVARLSKYILQFVEINMHDSLVVLFIGLTDVRLFKWIVLWLKDSSRRHLSICHLLLNAEKACIINARKVILKLDYSIPWTRDAMRNF